MSEDRQIAGGPIRPGDCARIPDGRVARVRDEVPGGRYRVRVRRETSKTHQFLVLPDEELERVACPKGWMSPEGNNLAVHLPERSR